MPNKYTDISLTKSSNLYKFKGRDGKEYTLDFKGGKDGYLGDDWFRWGTSHHTALAVAFYLNTGKKPTKEEFAKILHQAAGTKKPLTVDERDWNNTLRDLDTFIEKNDLEDYSERIQPGYTPPEEDYDPQANPYDLIMSPTSAGAVQYRDAMYGAINEQERTVDQSLAAAELDAYRLLGQNQLQLESQIAEQRMRALRSGTTSAQLASQELQNMFAGQSAAMGIAQQVMGQRVGNAQQFAQQRAEVEPSLYNMINQNQGLMSQVEAQRFAAQKGFEGYDPYTMVSRLQKLDSQGQTLYKDIIKPN